MGQSELDVSFDTVTSNGSDQKSLNNFLFSLRRFMHLFNDCVERIFPLHMLLKNYQAFQHLKCFFLFSIAYLVKEDFYEVKIQIGEI